MIVAMLDTSACIEILRGRPPPDKWRGYCFCLSTVVEAELWAGVHHSGGDEERRKTETLLAALETVPFDSAAAEATGRVLAELTKAGRKIGDFDVQIAGHALSLGAPLLTCDKRHFQRVAGLRLLSWPSSAVDPG